MSSKQDPDPHAGHGGSYIVDPKTGKRVLRERTEDPASASPGVPAAPRPKPAPARKR